MNSQQLFHGHKVIDPPDGVPVWDVDPFDTSNLTDGRRFFDQLRAKGPFAFLSCYGVLACGGYDVTKEVFSDNDRFVSSRGVGLSDFALEKPWRPPSRLRHRRCPLATARSSGERRTWQTSGIGWMPIAWCP